MKTVHDMPPPERLRRRQQAHDLRGQGKLLTEIRDALAPVGRTTDKPTVKRRGYLAKPLTPYQSDWVGFMYKKNIKLVQMFARRVKNMYGNIPDPEIKSMVDIAFIRGVLAVDAKKGKLSTIFYFHVRAEVYRYVTSNAAWAVSAPRKVRELGRQAQDLMIKQNVSLSKLPKILGKPLDEIRLALQSLYSTSSDEFADIECTDIDEEFEAQFDRAFLEEELEGEGISTWHG